MMRTRFAFNVTVLMLATSTFAQSTQDIVTREVARFSAGVVCTPLIVGQNEAPGTISGFTNTIEGLVEFTSTSRRVPAVIGISFGALVTAKSFDRSNVTVTLTHPPMGDAGVEVETYATYISATNDSPVLFSLEYDYELVTGPWRFDVSHQGQLLYTANFEVVEPQDLPELANICGYAELFS